jgi:hypothetical protein
MMAKDNPISGRSTRKQLLSIAAASAVAAATDATIARAGSTNDVSSSEYDPIVGSWLVAFNRPVAGYRGWGIWTFHGDGTVVSKGSEFPTNTTLHGHWRNLGGGQYAHSVVAVNVDASGNATGFTTVDTDITGQPQNISRIAVYDTNGYLTQQEEAQSTATKLPIVRRTDPTRQTLNLPQLP